MKCSLLAVMTADGCIAKSVDHSSIAWNSKEDQVFFSKKTKKAGVIVCGSRTFATFRKPLPGRLNVVYSRNDTLLRQSRADFSKQSKIPESGAWPSESAPVFYTQATPSDLLSKLDEAGYKEVVICGGTSIYTMFMKHGLVDNLYLTIEPKLFGTGVRLFNDSLEQSLVLKKIHKISDQTVVINYKKLK